MKRQATPSTSPLIGKAHDRAIDARKDETPHNEPDADRAAGSCLFSLAELSAASPPDDPNVRASASNSTGEKIPVQRFAADEPSGPIYGCSSGASSALKIAGRTGPLPLFDSSAIEPSGHFPGTVEMSSRVPLQLAKKPKPGHVADEMDARVGGIGWTPEMPADREQQQLTEFERWVVYGSPCPANMACYEVIFFCAVQRGLVSRESLRDFVIKIRQKAKFGNAITYQDKFFEDELGGKNGKPIAGGNLPLKGDLVIFREPSVHTALATGEVDDKDSPILLSLYPNMLERITLNAFLGREREKKNGMQVADEQVYFFTPKWSAFG